jgi:2-aminomuconate deaminase
VFTDTEGNIVGYDIEIQTEAVIANVKMVLEEAGSSFDKIVDVQVFLTDMKADFPRFNKVYERHFQGIPATRTTVEVGALPTPIAVEFKVIAL